MFLSLVAVITSQYVSHDLKKGVKIPKSGHKTITYRFSKFDDDCFLLDLSNSIISDVYNFSEPYAALHHWHEAFVNVYDKHAPFKTVRVRHTAKPKWLTKPVQDAIHYCDHLLKNGQHDEYKKQRNNVTPLLRASKTVVVFSRSNSSNRNSNIYGKL